MNSAITRPVMQCQRASTSQHCECCVDMLPEVNPIFNRNHNGTFTMELGPIRCKLTTTCMPPPPAMPGLEPFKPYEEFWVEFPELGHVVFDPNSNTPPNGIATAQRERCGAVLEVPRGIRISASVKSASPYGAVILERKEMRHGSEQKYAEATLNYQLSVKGYPRINSAGGNCGYDRLEIDFYFV